MKFPTLNKYLTLLDIPLLLKGFIVFGGFLILLSYPLNSTLIDTLSSNIGLSKITNQQVLFKSNFDPNLTTEDISIPKTTIDLLRSCKFIPKDSVIKSDSNDFLTIVNKSFVLETIGGYDDLVYLRDYGIDTNEFTRLRAEPAEKLRELINAAKQQGVSIFISSGYRTYEDQVGSFAYWKNLAGEATATKYAAKPGHSEHHLGTTVDILTYENWLKLLPSYEQTKLRKWLKSNAYLYGFVESYPAYTTSITGYTYEPWHYRYVGLEIANKLHDEKSILQDYLYRLNGYCLVE